MEFDIYFVFNLLLTVKWVSSWDVGCAGSSELQYWDIASFSVSESLEPRRDELNFYANQILLEHFVGGRADNGAL